MRKSKGNPSQPLSEDRHQLHDFGKENTKSSTQSSTDVDKHLSIETVSGYERKPVSEASSNGIETFIYLDEEPIRTDEESGWVHKKPQVSLQQLR